MNTKCDVLDRKLQAKLHVLASIPKGIICKARHYEMLSSFPGYLHACVS